MEMLTDRQRAILEFLREYAREFGRPPAIREIARRFGIASPKGVSDHLQALERKGYIRRVKGLARGLELMHEPAGIPIVGRVAAGLPITAEENIEGSLDVGSVFGRGSFFAVRVVGESMRDAGIHNGDFVIVKAEGSVEEGAIAVES